MLASKPEEFQLPERRGGDPVEPRWRAGELIQDRLDRVEPDRHRQREREQRVVVPEVYPELLSPASDRPDEALVLLDVAEPGRGDRGLQPLNLRLPPLSHRPSAAERPSSAVLLWTAVGCNAWFGPV